MPPKLRTLSAKDLIAIFKSFGFVPTSQRGSHIKLKRVQGGKVQILVIPNHKSMKRGTLLAIYKKARLYLTEENLKPLFYSE